MSKTKRVPATIDEDIDTIIETVVEDRGGKKKDWIDELLRTGLRVKRLLPSTTEQSTEPQQ